MGHRGLDATSSDPAIIKNVSLTDREGAREYEIRAAIRKKG